MDTSTWIIIAVVAAIVIAAALIALAVVRRSRRRRHSDELRRRFGSEYDRVVDQSKDGRAAERQLDARVERHERFRPAPLQAGEHELIVRRWEEIQGSVIDAPTRAVVDADRLLEDALVKRGYPSDAGERLEVLSVQDPALVDDYRDAHATAVRAFDSRANTEDCRQALLRYRRLFGAVLDAPDAVAMDGRPGDPAPERERIDPRRREAPVDDDAERRVKH